MLRDDQFGGDLTISQLPRDEGSDLPGVPQGRVLKGYGVGRAAVWRGQRLARDEEAPLEEARKVNIEALLIASGQNGKRLLAFGGRKPKKPA